jgi:hypothetical protein
MMNEALREYLSDSSQPVTEIALRQILRQEIPEYLREISAPLKTAPRTRVKR